MYEVRPTTRFQRDLKLAKRRNYDMSKMTRVIKLLASGQSLPARYKDHPLEGDYAGCRECHITPDWLLVYEIDNGQLILYLTRTGTHSDLF